MVVVNFLPSVSYTYAMATYCAHIIGFSSKIKAKKPFSRRPRANARLDKTISNAPKTMNATYFMMT